MRVRVKGKAEECSRCGQVAARRVRQDYFWEDVDLPVLLKNIEVLKCGKCGNVDPIIPKFDQLMRKLALGVIMKPYRLTGKELRFLRKYVGKTGADFSALIKVDRTTLSKWETGEDPIGEQSDRLIRAVVVALGDGLQEELVKAVANFANIQSEPKSAKIELDPKKPAATYEAA